MGIEDSLQTTANGINQIQEGLTRIGDILVEIKGELHTPDSGSGSSAPSYDELRAMISSSCVQVAVLTVGGMPDADAYDSVTADLLPMVDGSGPPPSWFTP